MNKNTAKVAPKTPKKAPKTCFDCLLCKTQNGGCRCHIGVFDFDYMPTMEEMDFDYLPGICGSFNDMDGEEI